MGKWDLVHTFQIEGNYSREEGHVWWMAAKTVHRLLLIQYWKRSAEVKSKFPYKVLASSTLNFESVLSGSSLPSFPVGGATLPTSNFEEISFSKELFSDLDAFWKNFCRSANSTTILSSHCFSGAVLFFSFSPFPPRWWISLMWVGRGMAEELGAVYLHQRPGRRKWELESIMQDSDREGGVIGMILGEEDAKSSTSFPKHHPSKSAPNESPVNFSENIFMMKCK